jgi:hypothetical protein
LASWSCITTGGEGTSLVKGVQMTLKAFAFLVKPGGVIGSVTVGGSSRTRGEEVVTFEIDDGRIDALTMGGAIEALGRGSAATAIEGTVPGLDDVTITEGS